MEEVKVTMAARRGTVTRIQNMLRGQQAQANIDNLINEQ